MKYGLITHINLLLNVVILSACMGSTYYDDTSEFLRPENPISFNSCPNKEPQSYDGFTLKWSDDFSSNDLNQDNWSYMYGDGSLYDIPGWGNNEEQLYVDNSDNIYLVNGCLFIIPTFKENIGYESARINTSEKFLFHFGRIDVSFSVPELTGVWPAIWLLPERKRYGYWPASGEIDLVETRNNASDELITTIHYGHDFHRYESKTTFLSQLSKLTNPDDHNIISIIWTEESVVWLLNNLEVFIIYFDDLPSIEPNPFVEQFHGLINVAVGGNFPGNPNSLEYCSARENCPDVKKLIIDYIAYYESDN